MKALFLLSNVVLNVTITDCPFQALELLRANIGNYDIVLIDVNLTCMDGYQLSENVSREISLPVIGILKFSTKILNSFLYQSQLLFFLMWLNLYAVLSVDSEFKNVMKGIKYGAIDYLVKPVRLEELKLIWKHVVKKFLNEKKNINESRSIDVNISYLPKKSKNLVRKRDEYDDIALKDNLASQKRARVSWTPELHAKFINAVNQLGINKAVPIKILDIMDIPGLTRENVASHLQLNKNNRKIALTQVHKSTRIQLMFQVIVWKIIGKAMLRIWQSYLSLRIWMTQMSFM
ncbi:hypothetical protein KFK09_017642 [Dendrobium nobile]|uniref:Uncharacterized protein n=1 Tax=Dendrobium nobile TaxID=94219 RepID=A0A8T3B7V4_DENNO|nr:hypothetical protein KFK09_017642 [Dendrobium nobile]